MLSKAHFHLDKDISCVNNYLFLTSIKLLIRLLKFTRFSVENSQKRSKKENKKNSRRNKVKKTLGKLWKLKKMEKMRRLSKNLVLQLPSQTDCNITQPLDYLKKPVRFVSSAKNKRTRLTMIFLQLVITIIMWSSILFRPTHKLHTSKTRK